jgi:hypothetical protein
MRAKINNIKIEQRSKKWMQTILSPNN